MQNKDIAYAENRRTHHIVNAMAKVLVACEIDDIDSISAKYSERISAAMLNHDAAALAIIEEEMAADVAKRTDNNLKIIDLLNVKADLSEEIEAIKKNPPKKDYIDKYIELLRAVVNVDTLIYRLEKENN